MILYNAYLGAYVGCVVGLTEHIEKTNKAKENEEGFKKIKFNKDKDCMFKTEREQIMAIEDIMVTILSQVKSLKTTTDKILEIDPDKSILKDINEADALGY